MPLNIISLYEDKYGNIWAGTFGKGVYCYEPENGQIRHLNESDGLSNGSVLSIAGTNGNVWLATLGGVTEIKCEQNIILGEDIQVKNFRKESGLGANFIYKVFIDSKGRTWFGTDGKGVSVLENGRITNYLHAGNIPLKAVYSITEDHRGHIWLSTAKEGIFQFDGENFSQLKDNEGIRDLAISSLVTDKKGNILIVHASGIDILNPQTRHIIYYDDEVGIHNIEPNLNAVCTDGFGNIWIGGQSRLIRYSSLEEDISIHPRVQLKSVSVFLEPIDFQNQKVFAHNQNNLIFEYAGLWFTAPTTVKYRYKLEGYNLDWIISRDRSANYSNLPPGDYTFQLSATENETFNNEPIVSYSFTLLPPLWQRWWFITLSLLVVFGIAFWIIKQREVRLQWEAMLKKEKIESQFEALKSQINPHFLFNSFNTLIAIIEEGPGLAVEFVEKLSDFYRSILQYREKEIIELQEELELVKNFAFLLKKRFGNNFHLHINANGETDFVAPLTLQMLVENAIKHNVISKARPLNIYISKEDDKYIVISNNLQKKMTAEKSTGFGLQNIANRYALLTDKKVKVEEVEGTFKVSIPIIKNGKNESTNY